MSKRLSYKIAFIQAALTILVAFGHSLDLDAGTLKERGLAGVLVWYGEYSLLVLSGVAVPLFFTISGYLMFQKYESSYNGEDYINELTKRLKSIVIPYFLWEFIALYISYSLHLQSDRFWLYRVILAEDNGPLWYLRNLFLYTLISPVLYKILRSRIGGHYLSASGSL